MKNFNLEFDSDIYDKARKYREKKEKENNAVSKFQFGADLKKPIKRNPKVVEEYTEDAFNEKISYDLCYYNFLVSNIEENQYEQVNEIIKDIIEDTKQIYEYGSIGPRIYGFKDSRNKMVSINENEEDQNDIIRQERLAKKEFDTFIKNNYYNSTTENILKKYGNSVVTESKEEILSENEEIQHSVEKKLKKVLVQEFIDKVSFPGFIKSHIEEFFLNDEFTDNSKFEEIFDSYQSNRDKFIDIIIETI